MTVHFIDIILITHGTFDLLFYFSATFWPTLPLIGYLIQLHGQMLCMDMDNENVKDLVCRMYAYNTIIPGFYRLISGLYPLDVGLRNIVCLTYAVQIMICVQEWVVNKKSNPKSLALVAGASAIIALILVMTDPIDEWLRK